MGDLSTPKAINYSFIFHCLLAWCIIGASLFCLTVSVNYFTSKTNLEENENEREMVT